MKRLVLCLLALILFSALLASCNGGESVETTEIPETSAEESEASDMISFDPSNYVIIYPNEAFKEKYLALLVSNAIATESEVRVAQKGDSEVAAGEFEILIGNTDRPESAEALEKMGESDFIVIAIGKKIAIIAKDDELYDAVVFRFIASVKNCEIPAELCIIGNTTKLDKVADSMPAMKAIAFEATLMHKLSAIQIRIGDAYAVEFSAKRVGLYTQEKKRTELASKVVLSDVGKKYNVLCSYDGEYLRAYLSDPESGLEPWSAFEFKADKLLGEVSVGEVSGYGAEISGIGMRDISAVSGTTYQNNVISNAADPDIIYHDGFYYMYVTGDHYPVYRSADLAKWEYVGVSLPEVSWNIDKRYMWAPDVEYIGGKFYMAVSMGEAGFGIAVADRPEGPFVCAGDMPFLTKTIDGHIFVDDDGRIYLYYTSWCDGRAYGIWGVEMESDCLTPKWETEKLIFTPTESWEMTMNMGKIVEAPYMLKKEGVYYLVYSGSNYQADYAVGYATSKSPLEGFVKSANNPILRGTADTRGTGHCSIIETPAGGMIMVYHVHNTPTAVQPRHVAIDPVRFVKTEGGYRLEVCGPTTSKVPIDIIK